MQKIAKKLQKKNRKSKKNPTSTFTAFKALYMLRVVQSPNRKLQRMWGYESKAWAEKRVEPITHCQTFLWFWQEHRRQRSKSRKCWGFNFQKLTETDAFPFSHLERTNRGFLIPQTLIHLIPWCSSTLSYPSEWILSWSPGKFRRTAEYAINW